MVDLPVPVAPVTKIIPFGLLIAFITFSKFVSEKPRVSNFDKDSELNNIINDSKSGIACESGNVMEIKHAILKLYDDRTLCSKMGNNGREYIKRNLDSNVCTKKYIQVLNEAISIKKDRWEEKYICEYY